MNSFSDRVALITGAASGIGRQFALALAAEGARIAGLDRDAAGLAALETELAGKPIATAVADVTAPAVVAASVRHLEARLGPVDLLIASAGLGKETSAANFDAEVMAEVIRVNLIGVSNSIAAVLPGMRERRRGHLAVLSSLASYHGLPGMAGYCASKAGVNAILDALRVELKPFHITVTTLCPGFVRTPMTDAVSLPDSVTKMPVEEAVRRMLDALRRKRTFFAFPTPSVWQMRLLRYLPRGLSDWLATRSWRQMEKSKTDSRAM